MSAGLLTARHIPGHLPRGRSKVPIVEVDKTIASQPGVRIVKPINKWAPDASALHTTTLGHSKSELAIRAWGFYHAAAKTELARSFTDAEMREVATGFATYTNRILYWAPENLRLRDEGVFARKDSSRTAIAGRFGEAATYLFMIQQGFVYWDHFPSLIERAMSKATITHREQLRKVRVIRSHLANRRPDKEPDYAFESATGKVALAEAKGAFIPPDASPLMVKSDLSHGLDQLNAWQDLVSPSPKKSFVVGLYLREQSDPFPDPSLLACVDPTGPDAPITEAVSLPDDWIRRGNYGAWLIGMGLIEAGSALRNDQPADVIGHELPVVTIGDRTFAIAFDGPATLPWWPEFVWEPFHPAFRPLFRDQLDVPVLGIEVDNLRIIEKAVSRAETVLPLNMAIGDTDAATFPESFSGSILPDGTLYGALHIGRSIIPMLETQKFRL